MPKALIPFFTAGDPSLKITEKLVLMAEKAGADLVELGIPFSDPMADGPVIQSASERALKKGVTLEKVLGLVRSIRKKSDIPLLLMGYYNPIYSFGLKRYAREAKRAGVDATLVVDLPPEESTELDRELKKVGISLIYLLTPTSDAERIRKVCRKARRFIYFVSVTGITGSALKDEKLLQQKIRQIRRQTKLPVVIGFGISKPEQAKRMARLADGVVVGSALVSLIHRTHGSVAAAQKMVANFRKAV
ncbi:MAG: tryptophan synthase subunit alpha [Deltaproteobacteria bacterium]|nr:tryptophan synthase subunit alpha [Deltaproteobacteria bacterium]